MKKSMLRNGLILAIFAFFCTALVALVDRQTFDKIKEQQQLELKRVLHQIIPDTLHDNELIEHCILIHNEEVLGIDSPLPSYIASMKEKPVAIAMETVAPDGYSGNIRLIIGISAEGEVLGVRTLSHAETPGLGDKIEMRKSDWVLGFNGMFLLSEDDTRWNVKKDGGEIDQFTGATITPRAYVKAIKRALVYFNANKDRLLARPANCEVNYQ